MKMIFSGVNYFLDFHKGTINIILHILGLGGLLYSIHEQKLTIFIAALIILESGHLYNHFTGIKKYNLRWSILFWRVVVFILFVTLTYTIMKL